MRPVYSDTTERAFTDLGPWSRADGEDTGWALLHHVAAIGEILNETEVLVRDTDDGSGWSGVMDVDRVPSWALGWLAQFVGVELLFGLDDESQRIRVRGTAGFRRGTLGAIQAAAAQFLTGTRHAEIYERWGGSAYQLRVVTYTSETPDPAAVLAALTAQTPGGIILTYEVQEGLSWDQLVGTWDAQPGTWDDFSNLVPGGP